MATAASSIDIDRPVADVWRLVADLGATPRWRTTLTEVVPPAALAPGARFTATTRLLGRSWRWLLEVTAVETERLLAYRVVEGFTSLAVDYRLEPLGDGCRFTLTGSSTPRRLVERALEPVAAGALRRQSRRHLENLRGILEGR